MNKQKSRFNLPLPSWSTTVSMLTMSLVLLYCSLTVPIAPGLSESGPPGTTSEAFSGRILQILDQSDVNIQTGSVIPYQVIVVEITEGEQKGQIVEVEHGAGLVMSEHRNVKVDDKVLVQRSTGPAGEQFYISDFVRLPFLVILALGFAAATVIVGQRVGLRSLVSMGYTLLIIAFYILPRLVVGKEPVQVCVVGALLAMTPSLYLTYGINWKTHSALMGLGVSLLVTGILAAASMDWGHMTGFSSDEATFLVAAIDTPLDLRDLLLGGIIISVLGVLDDVCIGQASTILELRKANPALKWRNLFQRGMRVGRDHIASVVNTLMMAYIGAAMPLFLLLFVSNTPILQTLNRELLAEEIVRTLVGSLGLILAVPITSVIASLVAQNLEIEPLPRM